jgi:hypothetical protein
MLGKRFITRIHNEITEVGRDELAVSIPINHALGLLVLLTLSSTLTAGVVDINEQRQETAVQQELDRIANEVVAGLEATNGLARQAERHNTLAGGSVADAETRVELPHSIGGASYSVTVNSDGGVTVQSQGMSSTVNTKLRYDVQEAGVGKGDVIITYDSATGELNVVSA